MIPRLIALDLDETLLDRESHLPPRNRAALDQAMAQGIEIAVATGRAFHTVPREILEFTGIRYVITGNGAAVYRTDGTAIIRRVLPPEAAQEALERTRGEDVQYEVFVDGAAYAQADYLEGLETYMMDSHTCAYVRATRRPVEDIREFIRENAHRMDSLAVIPRDMDTKARVMNSLREIESVYITTSSVRLIEVNHRDCTKASGLRFLAELLAVPRELTAAFGNGDNDAEMLAWAGCGVAVAEGTELCRASADYVTGSYLENGVAEAIRTLWGIAPME